MSDLPKIVHERLRALKSVPDIHPDADLLTAFAEKSLTAPERARLMDHFAHCADCRDLIALALPAIEGVQDIRSGAETHAGWFRWPVLRWPVLRWGVVVAGIAIAASAGILEFQHRENSKALAALHRNAVTSTAAVSADRVKTDRLQGDLEGNQAPSETKLASSGATTDALQPLNSGDRANTALAASTPGSTTAQRQKAAKTAPARDLFLAQDLKKWAPTQADKQFSPDAQRPDSSSEAVVSAQEQAAEVAAAPAPTQSPIQSKESLQARAAEPVFSDQATVAKAKPAVINPAINGGGSAAPPSQQNQLTTLPLYRAPARWTINSSGILQRSFDGGKSWLAVHVDTTAAASANDTMTRTAPAKAATGGVPAERVAGGRATKDENAKVVFRAVFAAGSDVWAGGSGGMLYHSIDGGEQWSEVRPFAANESSAADILSIEFSDGMRGKITTSRPELWVTSNGGESWQQQKQ